jgi:beta-xylosidase
MRALLSLCLLLGGCPGNAQAPSPEGLRSPETSVGGDRGADRVGGDRTAGETASVVVSGQNPVLTGDHPDPHVLRTIASDGKPIYYLTHTSGVGDFPLYSSRDLLHWQQASTGIFQRAATAGGSIKLATHYYCAMWAPQIVELGASSFLLSFSAQRFSAAPSSCPAYNLDGGVYLAWASSPLGPFADAQHPWEPLPAGGQISTCSLRTQLPRSVDVASKNCQGGYCHQVIRLDSDVFRDPQTGRWWLAYAWYTNSPPLVDWEKSNHGEHVEIVELDASDPFAVRCDLAVPQIFAANAHDAATLSALAAYCPRCGEMLSMTRGRQDEEMKVDGYSWGVAEGPNLFRRGDYVYALISGSAYDSAYYHVFFAAAKNVEDLVYDGGKRIVGRYLIPGQGQSFGHGSVVVGPDGTSLFFVHHRLDHGPCKASGQCGRDVWVSPLEFEDRKDGKGEVWIKPRFPAEDPKVSVRLP